MTTAEHTTYWTPFAGPEFEDNMKLTMVSVVVYGVPGDGQVVAVVVRVESCENRPANREENGLTQIALKKIKGDSKWMYAKLARCVAYLYDELQSRGVHCKATRSR